ncbi:MAG: alpha/beta fold hydrolase [Clostridiaceae bacterium]|nr:alpha/beta fold hydrolase [Clostridiaceae bacterium]
MKISGVSYIQRKRHTMKNLFVFIFVTVLLVSIVIMSISSYVGWDLTHPEKRSIPVFSSNIVPEYENISFKDKNNSLTLKGWLFTVKGSNKTVILAHGYGQNRLQFGEETIDLIKGLLNAGYNVLTFDFRNNGESEGNLTTVGILEKDDLLGAVEFIKQRGSSTIVLMGFSMGASTALVAAQESLDVDAVIADSPFSDLTEYLNSNLSVWSKLPPMPFNQSTLLSMKVLLGIDTKTFSPVKSIGIKPQRPVLLIHSKDDEKIPVENSYTLLGAGGKTVQLWETSGVGHVGSFTGYKDEYLKRVIDFLDKINVDLTSK